VDVSLGPSPAVFKKTQFFGVVVPCPIASDESIPCGGDLLAFGPPTLPPPQLKRGPHEWSGASGTGLSGYLFTAEGTMDEPKCRFGQSPIVVSGLSSMLSRKPGWLKVILKRLGDVGDHKHQDFRPGNLAIDDKRSYRNPLGQTREFLNHAPGLAGKSHLPVSGSGRRSCPITKQTKCTDVSLYPPNSTHSTK